MSEFIKALLGSSAASKIPEEYDWFAPLLGDWDFDYYDVKDGRRERHVEGEWLFRRALDGTGIEDLFICPSRATRESNPQQYRLRLVEETDGADLLKVYSDEKAVPFFNSDNCHGDLFHYTSLERMVEAIQYWLWEYERQGFVRWSILDHVIGEVIGTIELFHRDAEDYFTNCGLLRLDLRSDYEKKECITELLKPLILSAFGMFSCEILATKGVPEASERVRALEELGFQKSSEVLIGHDGTQYGSYWILTKGWGNF